MIAAMPSRRATATWIASRGSTPYCRIAWSMADTSPAVTGSTDTIAFAEPRSGSRSSAELPHDLRVAREVLGAVPRNLERGSRDKLLEKNHCHLIEGQTRCHALNGVAGIGRAKHELAARLVKRVRIVQMTDERDRVDIGEVARKSRKWVSHASAARPASRGTPTRPHASISRSSRATRRPG